MKCCATCKSWMLEFPDEPTVTERLNGKGKCIRRAPQPTVTIKGVGHIFPVTGGMILCDEYTVDQEAAQEFKQDTLDF